MSNLDQVPALAPPQGEVPDFDAPNPGASRLFAGALTTLLISTLSVIARVYTRWIVTRERTHDDGKDSKRARPWFDSGG